MKIKTHAHTEQAEAKISWENMTRGLVLVLQAARSSDAGAKSLVRKALDCARLRASLELEGGESLMEQTMAPTSSCCSSCWDSCRLKAMASAANWVRSLVLLFLEEERRQKRTCETVECFYPSVPSTHQKKCPIKKKQSCFNLNFLHL